PALRARAGGGRGRTRGRGWGSRSAACAAVSRRSTNSRTHPYGIFIGSRELSEEAQVVLEEQSQIVDAVLQHRDALDAHPECPAGEILGIVADVRQNPRM